jgi:DNA polymerase III subunit alpha, Gram-positive type
MNFSDRAIILTDVETTGLDPRRHEIIDIGAIKIDQNLNVLGRFATKVKPQFLGSADPVALKINGYSPDAWGCAEHPWTAFHDFHKFSAGEILAGWNVAFEFMFLKDAFQEYQVADIMTSYAHLRIDLPSIAWALIPGLKKFSLNAVGAHFYIPPEFEPHTAIGGAEYELEVFRHLKGRLL